MILVDIIERLKLSDLSLLTDENVRLINSLTVSLLNKSDHTVHDINNMSEILWISNVLYNNTDRNILPLEDGVYDLLLELYRTYSPNFQVGAEPIYFDNTESYAIVNKVQKLYKEIDLDIDSMLFYNNLTVYPDIKPRELVKPLYKPVTQTISKRLNINDQMFPELVGTLDKCKFVLSSQAEAKGVINDSNVKILERDFFGKHIEMSIINMNDPITVVCELKYDGVSAAAGVTNVIDVAFTRGDANEGKASDLTPILKGYRFPRAYDIPKDDMFGVKFEAIMTNNNLARYNIAKNKNYSNCRTAISGLFSSSDACEYMDYITLVPLATTLSMDRVTEIEFLNEFYQTGEPLRYAVITGNYLEVLFQIKRFVEEAEYVRPYMPFMYDGVVISYVDQDKIQALGRINSVNKYSVAVKFNADKKQTVFRGYTFTVGQDGSITPMIHYDPVEFFGTIHNKSTGHSFERFKQLSLKYGDIIDVEYVNDVMPYVTKPDNSHNAENTNNLAEFITLCPSCNSTLEVSKSEKSIMCTNIECPERNLKRIVALMQKLNLKDFSEAHLSAISKYSLTDILNLERKDVLFLGDKTSEKFMDRINELKTKELYDFKIIGALGFTGVASEKWKLILNVYNIQELLHMSAYNQLREQLVQIKGIGPGTADIIVSELPYFLNDILTIARMSNVISSKGMKCGLSIRFTGFRNQDLMNMLIDMGHDASDKNVTKTTDILLIPYLNFTSSKTNKIGEQTKVIPVQEFINNMDYYLQ